MLRSNIELITFLILGLLFIQGCGSEEEHWKRISSRGEINSVQKIRLKSDSPIIPSNYEFHHHHYNPDRKEEIVFGPIGERVNSDFLYFGFVKTTDKTVGQAIITPVVASIEKDITNGRGKLEIVYLGLPNKPNVLAKYLVKKVRSKAIKLGVQQARNTAFFTTLGEKIRGIPISRTISRVASRYLGINSVIGLYKDAFNAWKNALNLYEIEPIGLSDTYIFELNRNRFFLASKSRGFNTFEKDNPSEVSSEMIPIIDFNLDSSKEGRIIRGEIQLSDTTKQIIELTLSDRLLNPGADNVESPPATGILTTLDRNSIFNTVRGKEFIGKCRFIKNNEPLEEFDIVTSFFERSDSKIEMVVETTTNQHNKKYFFNKLFFYFNRQGNRLKFHGNPPFKGYFYETLELDEPSPETGWLFPYVPSKIGFDEPYPYNYNYQYAREGTYTPFIVDELSLEVLEDVGKITGLIKTKTWEIELDTTSK